MIEPICLWGKRFIGGTERPPDSRMHFTLLTGRLKHAYMSIVDACYSGRTQVYLPQRLDRDDITALNEAIRWDNPSLTRVPSISCSTYPEWSIVKIDYVLDKTAEGTMAVKIAPVIERLICNTQGMDDYEKELFVHDYLASTVVYDRNRPFSHQAFGPLVCGYGVCSGISMAFSYVLNSMGIDCCTVYGRVKGSKDLHAWNVVNIGGEDNYHVDVTFDLKNGDGGISHEYFNLDDGAMLGGRECMSDIRCSGLEYNYYYQSGSQADTLKELSDTIDRQIPKGVLEFRMGPDLARRFTPKSVSSFVEGRINDFPLRGYSRISTSFNSSTGCCNVRLT